MNRQETINKLNNKSERTVLDCIDRPIRNLVIQLHRIGLYTKFSCCGFSYDNEEEPKSHATKSFVVIHPMLNSKYYVQDNMTSFINLGIASTLTGWNLTPYNAHGEWHLM